MFLTLRDYYSTIQAENLDQILNEDDSFRTTKELSAISEIRSYLIQRYDMTREFADTKAFSFSATYNAGQLVYLDGNTFNQAATYTANDIVLYTGNVYYALGSVSAGVFNPSDWQLLGPQYSLFYIPAPAADYDSETFYTKGDYVFYKNKVYIALTDSRKYSQQDILQYPNYESIPPINSTPDDSYQTQWGSGTTYSISGLWPIAVPTDFTAWSSLTTYTTGQRVSYASLIYQAQANSTNVTPGTDHTKWQVVAWINGDNRNARMVECAIHITLYRLSSRISPRMVPELWVKNYDDEISWLKRCAKGEITLEIPLIQPRQGARIRYGGSTSRTNDY